MTKAKGLNQIGIENDPMTTLKGQKTLAKWIRATIPKIMAAMSTELFFIQAPTWTLNSIIKGFSD